MSRDLTSVVETALSADVIEPFFAVDLLFDSPDQVYLWNGIGDLTIGSKTYLGAGELLQIAAIEETANISARGATISLSGIDNSASSLFLKALSTPYHNRECKIYFGVMGTPADYVEIFSGFMDQMSIDEGPDSTTITLTVENKLIALERPAGTRYTAASQRDRHSGDAGLDFVAGLQTKKIIWGAIPE